VLTVLIGRRLVALHFAQYQREADFRYGLVRVRDNAESIAFFRGEKREHRDLVGRFVEVLRNSIRIIGWNRNLAFFTNGYNYVALVLPAIIVAPMYMSGAVEFGVVTQAEGAFAQVLMAMSMIVAQIDGPSASTAGMQRPATLGRARRVRRRGARGRGEPDRGERRAQPAEARGLTIADARRNPHAHPRPVLALAPGDVLIMGERLRQELVPADDRGSLAVGERRHRATR
jgi:ABC-type uncharacterized transport system fused permease/ATPase subunit